MQYLISVCSKETGPDKFTVEFKITHQDIAALAGITRETASIQIKLLEEEGAISQKRGKRLIINRKLLPPE